MWFLYGIVQAQEVRKITVQIPEQSIVSGFYTTVIPLNNFSKPLASLSDLVYSPASFTPEVMLADETVPEVHIGMERKKPFAVVRIPVYKTDENHQLQRLSSCTISIRESESQPSPEVAQKTTATSSVLADGTWYKIAVQQPGIHKIDYAFLKDQLKINPKDINPAHIRLFGNGGAMLPEANSVEVPDDLLENAIEVYDGNDGKMDEGDYFLFYAQGPTSWEKDSINKSFQHVKHLYSDHSYYFLCFDKGVGLRISKQQNAPAENVTVTDFNDYQVHEEDIHNIGKFGKEWFGEEFGTEPGMKSSRTFTFETGTLTEDAKIHVFVGCRSFAPGNTFTMYVNGQNVATMPLNAVIDDAEAMQLSPYQQKITVPITGTTTEIQLDFSPGIYSGRGYLNYLRLNTRRKLALTHGQILFRDWNSVGAGNVAKYIISNANSQTKVWDITHPQSPVQMNSTLSGSNLQFKREADRLREFIAFDGSNFHIPTFIGNVPNQNLHGASQPDMIIVTAPEFLDAANQLAAHHAVQSNLETLVATTHQVYNEFGSGSQDISAIRNFVRMFYKRAGSDTSAMPKYLLLLGDASYDYKDRLKNNTNYVPTYETAESINPLSGFCSDDFYTFLDDHENIEASVINTMDISVGRLPATTPEAAMDMVNKIKRYTSPQSLGVWRTSATIITDNEDGNTHLMDGEIMASEINRHTNLYNETKIHLSAIPVVSTPAGARAPQANKMINDQVFKGTFLINYNGHGSIYTLTSERILTQDDFNTWKNPNKMPIMITATCDFSRFDNPEYVSAGEKLILKPDGGAAALLTTTQVVYQHLNRTMNRDFLEAMFQKYDGKWATIGDALRFSKNKTYSVVTNKYELVNFRKFTLLGDPAVRPAFPLHHISVTEVIDDHTGKPADTIKALGKYTIKGEITTSEGNLLNDFNGRINLTLFDKPQKGITLTEPYKEFPVRNNVIYRGLASVKQGKFAVTFITPKDLNYEYGPSKISIYAENGLIDAAGSDTSMISGGFSDNPIIENNPPIVKPFINDSLFRNGGITGNNTLLYVQLFDETGINVSGNSIGHDLTAILDDNVQQPYILNDYYETAADDYRKGYVYFPISGLSDGPHTIRVKAWDANNNSGEGTVNFVVVNGKVVQIQNLMNYPNPFQDKTHFVFEHNHPGEELDVTLDIFSTSGYHVTTINKKFTPNGSRSHEITWDGTAKTGAKLPTGVYMYKLTLTTQSGIQSAAYQKLVLIR